MNIFKFGQNLTINLIVA